jgi:transcriptional regulator with XRE-family HTH domain
MIKFKLLEVRKRRNISQEQMAKALSMDVSGYSRRENGQIKISIDEWGRMANELKVPIEQIYESDDQSFFINQDNSNGASNTVFGNTQNEAPSYIHKYIEKLEEENQYLKEENQLLKNENKLLKKEVNALKGKFTKISNNII